MQEEKGVKKKDKEGEVEKRRGRKEGIKEGEEKWKSYARRNGSEEK